MTFLYTFVPLLFFAVLAPSSCEQFGTIVCDFNLVTGQVVAHLFAYKNGSDVQMVYVMNGTEAIFTENNKTGCQFSGTGSDDDPFQANIHLDYRTGEPSPGSDDCGAYAEITGQRYSWLVHTQTVPPLLTHGDIIFEYICDFTYRLRDTVSFIGNITKYEFDTSLETTRGLLRLQVVDDNMVVNIVQLGAPFRLSLDFLPATNAADPELLPWGAYCERLFAMPADGSTQLDLLDRNLCPRSDTAILRPNEGFTKKTGGTGGTGSTGSLYNSKTGHALGARFDKVPDSETVVFVCEAKLCWMPNDLDCIDPCAARSVTTRKRREVVHRVSAKIRVVDPQPRERDTAADKGSAEISMFVWLGIGVGAVFVVFVICLITAFALRRQRPEKYRPQKDSLESSRSSSFSRRPKAMHM